jgi:hypothetical protein
MRIFGVVILLFISLVSFAGANSAPFSLTIAGPEAPVKSGAEIKIRLSLTNTSDREITIFDTSRDCDYQAEVFRSDGSPARGTEYKRGLKCEGTLIVNRNVLITLKPHQSTEDNLTISDLYDMRSPGKFRQICRASDA